MAIGIITGRKVEKNRDGDKDRIILQVEMMEDEDDVRAVELFSQAGDDVNPADGCRVYIPDDVISKIGIAVSDDIAPESDPGEREIYSTDDPVSTKKSRTKWTKDGDIIHDADGGAKIEMDHGGDLTLNEGTDHAVRFSELKDAFDELQNDMTTLKNVFSTWVVVPMDGGGALKVAAAVWAGTPLIENIDDAKIDDIMVPAP